MIPTSEVTIIDMSDTDGMRATGMHDFEADDVFEQHGRSVLGLPATSVLV